MSSQSVNASTYSGYQASATLNYTSPRDSSDYTRMIRERIRYNTYKTGTVIPPGNAECVSIAHTNSFRLSYLFGKLKCGVCAGNAIYGNGPYVNNVGGISAS
jgi:hypothetical protein